MDKGLLEKDTEGGSRSITWRVFFQELLLSLFVLSLASAVQRSCKSSFVMNHFSFEWWSFELLVFLSGLLPNPQLETSVLSICLSIISTLYTIPEATGSAASARVSNALGAGCPHAARLSVYAAMAIAVSEAILIWLISLSVIVDSLHGTLSGIARGCGWQKLGAYVNLGAYYVFGIPIAVILGFWFELRGKGLWIGIIVGASCQAVLLSLITSFTNWEKQAIKARERIFQEGFAVERID